MTMKKRDKFESLQFALIIIVLLAAIAAVGLFYIRF